MKKMLLGAAATVLFIAGCAAGSRWTDADLDELNAEVASQNARIAYLESLVAALPQATVLGYDNR